MLMTPSHETLVAYLPRSSWLSADFYAIEKCIKNAIPAVEGAHTTVGQLSTSKWKAVPFGPLRWNDKSFSKWLHDAPGNDEISHEWEFIDFEASVPSPSKWDMHGSGPDLFIALANYKNGLRTDPSDVISLLQISIGQCTVEGANTEASEKLDRIRDCLNPIRSFRKNWKWAPFSAGGGVRNVFLHQFAKGRRVSLDALTERVQGFGWRLG